jgi:hypothetical protein
MVTLKVVTKLPIVVVVTVTETQHDVYKILLWVYVRV